MTKIKFYILDENFNRDGGCLAKDFLLEVFGIAQVVDTFNNDIRTELSNNGGGKSGRVK